MKKLLGSLLCVLSFLDASYSWSVATDKNTYYEEEEFLTTFTCKFSDRSPDVYIEFTPKVKGFEFRAIASQDRVINDKRVAVYHFLSRATKAGAYDFSLKILMRTTTDASITETILGRDNDQDIDFDDKWIETKSKKITIKKLPKDISIVGNFSMQVSYSKEKLKAYEPLQIRILITGNGDFDKLEKFMFDAQGIKVFSPKEQKKYTVTKEGLKGSLIWQYALTSAHDFSLKAQSISYFDVKAHTVKKLLFKGKSFKVEASTIEAKVDERNYPPIQTVFDFKALLMKVFYFFLGMLFVLLVQQIRVYLKRDKGKEISYESMAELLSFLVLQKGENALISEIENDMKIKKLKKVSYYVKKMKTH